MLLLAPSLSFAQAPASVPLQGYLTDAEGLPIDGDTPLILSLYDNDVQVFSEVQVVTVDNGAFVVYLGQGGLDLSLFQNGGNLSLGITVGDGEELSPRFDLGTAPFAAFAEYAAVAGDAQTVGGMPATDFAQADALEWTSLQNVPDGLADGDDDTLAGLEATCGAGEVATWDGGMWVCAAAAPSLSATSPVTLTNDTIGLNMGSGSMLDADTLDGLDSTAFAAQAHTHTAADIQGGTFPFASFDTYGDLANEGRLDDNAGDDLLTRTQADNRFVNVGEAPTAHSHDAAAITSGSLDAARFDAYNDLAVSARLDNNAGDDLLTRAQADARYVEPGEVGVITGTMISDGTITSTDLSASFGLSSDQIDYGTSTTISTSDCGTFVVAKTCPAGDVDLQGCNVAVAGTFCEWDSGCTVTTGSFDNALDNCGIYDVYFRTN